jgi:hypothetical protein
MRVIGGRDESLLVLITTRPFPTRRENDDGTRGWKAMEKAIEPS